jgi:sugar lactone lactonase YvrE
MKNTPAQMVPSIQRSARWSRLLVSALALSLSASGWAQNVVSTLAGTGSAGAVNGTGAAASFQFTNPSAVAVDATGNLFVADAANHVIRKVTPLGVVTTFAGTAGSTGSVDGAGATLARFNQPQGLAIDGAGNLYVADSNNHTVRMVTPSAVVSTLAGTATFSGAVNAAGALARFNQPLGITADRAGAGGAAVNIFVADTQSHSIRQIVVATGVVTTLAGTGTSGAVNGTGPAASFNHPDALVTNAAGTTVYVADTFNHVIRAITVPGGVVTTVAGTASLAGQGEGTGTAATFDNPAGIALDGSGNLLVADTFNHTIRSITLPGGVVSTYAGLADASGTTDGLAAAARFNFPSGIAFSSFGANVFVVDTNNQVIRKSAAAVAAAISSQPVAAAVAVGASPTFSVVATGNPTPTYQWQFKPAGSGTFVNITPSATYTGSTTATLAVVGVTSGMTGDQFQVLVSNGVGTVVTSSAAALTVTQAPIFTSAASTNFTIGQAGTFTVTAAGTPAPTLSRTAGIFPSWASFNTATGVLSGQPIDAVGAPFSFTLTATSSAGTVNQSFSLTVLTGPAIATQPVNATASPGTNVSYSVAATSNSGALLYQWQRQAVGTVGFVNLADNGHYAGSATVTLSINTLSLAEHGDEFRVVVTSGAGSPATSTSAALTVTQAPVITSLAMAAFVEGQPGLFIVQATGSPAPSFSLTGGSLPAGLVLAPFTGVISGTPAVGSSSTPIYTVQITASNAVAPSAQQTLILSVSPTALVPAFSTQPVSVSASLGQAVTYTVVATGTPTPTLQWQRQLSGTSSFENVANGSNFSGVTTATLILINPNSGMTGDSFRAVATSTSGTASSNPATLTLVIGTSLSTFAGQAGAFGSTDATTTAARFNTPTGLAVDSLGNIYVADTTNHVIRKITSAGVVTTLAGSPGASGNLDGTGSAARFNAPGGVAVNSVGTVYVADTYSHTIRMITAQGVVTTLAGAPGVSGSANGMGAAAQFNYPAGVAVDPSGNVFVADTFNHTIRRITADGTVSVFAGSSGIRGGVNDLGGAARFAYPNALATDSSGNLYVADSYNHVIRRVLTTGLVSTLAGTFGTVGTTDSPALFNQPLGVAVDSSGNVYVADTFSSTIRRITPVGVVSTLAGLPSTVGSVDGIGSAARLNQPYGIAVDAAGKIYVSDTRNHTIRRSGTVTAPQIQTQPAAVASAVGGTVSFSVAATGAPTPAIFQWQRQPVDGSGFVVITDGAPYSGASTATLSVAGVTSAMNGDQFRVLVSNLISPEALSNAVALTVGTAPVFTSAATATFQAAISGSFTVAATSATTVTFSATGLPSWATLNAATGAITGTPVDTAGSPVTVAISANNGLAVTQALVITVTPAVIAPAITVQPVSASVDQGQIATLSVTATGTAPLNYQWLRNGVALASATSSTFSLASAQVASAGSYTVRVTNAVGSLVSNGATLVVNAVPSFVSQPRAQSALAGSSVVFSTEAEGGANFTYIWRKNGVAIAGATGSTLALSSVAASDAGNYDVLVSNALGQVGSSLAQLSVVSAPTAPVITAQPANRTVLLGATTTFSVSASGAPAPSFQWRRNGTAIANATNANLVINNAQAGDAFSYDVVVTNSVGNISSERASLRVLARSYAGYYFGTFSGSLGNYAIYVRDDNSAVFLGYLPGSNSPVMNLNITVNDAGQFAFSQGAIALSSAAQAADEPARAAALAASSLAGTIASDGTISGTMQGGASATLSGTRAADAGGSQAVAGFYQSGASGSAATSFTIAGPANQAVFVTQSGAVFDGGLGSVNGAGQVNISGKTSTIAATIAPSTRTITVTSTGGIAATFSGASDDVLARARLVNISSRARVGTLDSLLIAGFVISGEESKPVLIRAVGPTLATLGVAGALASPKLELFRDGVALAVNSGIAANRTVIDAAGLRAGAFVLGGADAAILTTLAPGSYTAQVSSATSALGVALVEVYDLSAPATGQKLINISTRASAGTVENALTAGFVVPAGAVKRVLVRAVGPGLTVLKVAGALLQPSLTLRNRTTGVAVAQNTNWTTSLDAAAITAASAQVAFPLANNDSAMIVTLLSGEYVAEVSSPGAATGVALIEVYELQ